MDNAKRFERSSIASTKVEHVATAVLQVHTKGQGFTEVTGQAGDFLSELQAQDGVLLLFLRHTSASLIIQENADSDVQHDLMEGLDRLAPENAGWIHTTEGPDDMPAHVKAMLSGVTLHVPVIGQRLALGTWQGIYLVEHRRQPHRREIVLQFMGSRGPAQ
jgi:secondary thiamine-phosphate synthase enzyme